MNWNGQRQYLDHLISIRAEPDKAAIAQAAINDLRRKAINKSLLTRPVFLPVTFEMTAAGQTSPYRDTTELLNYDVIVTGVKADVQTRDIIVKYTENERSLVYIGDELNLYLRSDEVSGQSVASGGGQLGAFYFPSPIPLKAGRRLTVELFKTDTTDAVEEANLVFIGVRVYPPAYGQMMLDGQELAKIENVIGASETPQTRFLKLKFDFDTAVYGGQARNLFTPKVDQPLLVRGMRTSLRYSLIEMGLQGEPTWTVEPTPIWAIAAEDDLGHDNYQWFSKPVYLKSNTAIEVRRVVNGINGGDTSIIDARTGNTITWICETV